MRASPAVLLLAAVAACGESAGSPAASDTSDAVPDATASDVASPETSDDAVGGDTDGGAASDTPGDAAEAGLDAVPDGVDPTAACGGTGSTYTFVLSTLAFARLDGSTSEGLDLDGRTSDFRDAEGCFAADAVSPDGREGIDNNFATLLPALEQIGGDAIEGLIQAAINAGELLVFVTLEHVDSLVDDDCVVVTAGRADGAPDLGTDGRIAPAQTFDFHPDYPPTPVGESEIVDGELVAGTFDFLLPVNILGTPIELTAAQASLAVRFRSDGGADGFLAGGIPLSDIMRIADQVDFGDNTIAGVVRNLAPTFADLAPDDGGDCQAISVTLLHTATRAYFYPDATPASAP